MITPLVIVSYDHWEWTERSLLSLLKTTPHGRFHLVLVDHGSTEASEELPALLSDFRHATLIAINQRIHASLARNVGIAAALQLCPEAMYLASFDNDVIYHEGWLDKGIELLRQDGASNVGILGLAYGIADNVHRVLEEIHTDAGNIHIKQDQEGHSWLMRKGVINQVGLFNPKIGWTADGVQSGYMDSNYVVRTQEHGWSIGSVEEDLVKHEQQPPNY